MNNRGFETKRENNLKVVIVLGRCNKTEQLYGIRFEENIPSHWIADWAFSVTEKSANREGFHSHQIQGSFSFSDQYPGCPGCGTLSSFRCSCGKVSCWNGNDKSVTCPWCHQKAAIDHESSVKQLNVGNDI